MASTLNKIGDLTFLTLSGAIDPPGQELELIARPGVNGVAAWLTGTRGQPFQLIAALDCGTLADAEAAVVTAKALIGADPVNIIKASHDYSTQQLVFLVINVRAINGTPHLLGGCTGGLNPPSGAWLELAFELLAIRSAS